MKKQYVNGYGKENRGRERVATIILVGVCVLTVAVTLLVMGIMSSDDVKDTPTVVSGEEENIEVVEAKEPAEEEEPLEQELQPEPLKFAPPCSGGLLKEFSVEMPVYSETLDDWRIHEGIDISAPLGTEVKAVADGIISDKYEDLKNGYTVVIDHEGGMRSIYSNLAELDTAVIGAHVSCGDVIGSVGDTTLFETIADMHLHMELTKDGTHVNPLDYFELSE